MNVTRDNETVKEVRIGIRGTQYVCTRCGRKFFISDEEAEWYISKGYKIPTHCRACREYKKIYSTPIS